MNSQQSTIASTANRTECVVQSRKWQNQRGEFCVCGTRGKGSDMACCFLSCCPVFKRMLKKQREGQNVPTKYIHGLEKKYLPLNKKGSRGCAPGFCATSTQHRARSYRLAASEAWRRAHCRGEMSAEEEGLCTCWDQTWSRRCLYLLQRKVESCAHSLRVRALVVPHLDPSLHCRRPRETFDQPTL